MTRQQEIFEPLLREFEKASSHFPKRNWRAVMGFEDLINRKKVKGEFVEKVAGVIGEITK